LFPLPGGLRRLPHRSPAGSRRRHCRSRLGFAPPSLSLAFARCSSPGSLRSLRGRHLSLRIPFSLHVFFLVRGPHRHPSALLESPRVWPLPSFDLLELHPISSELDYSVR